LRKKIHFFLLNFIKRSLFEQHDITNKKSIESISKLGGIIGLANALKTDLNVYSFFFYIFMILKDGINPINAMDMEERKNE